MKRIIIILAFLVCGISSAQQYFFNGTVYVPKTTVQINAIVSPPEGRVEANSDTGSLWYFDGTIWKDTFVGVSSFADLDGDPYDNAMLSDVLNSKANDSAVVKINPNSLVSPLTLAVSDSTTIASGIFDPNTVVIDTTTRTPGGDQFVKSVDYDSVTGVLSLNMNYGSPIQVSGFNPSFNYIKSTLTDLDYDDETNITIIPAPGPGKVIVIQKVVTKVNITSVYVGSGTNPDLFLGWDYPRAKEVFTVMLFNDFNSTGKTWRINTSTHVPNFATNPPFRITDIENTPIVVSSREDTSISGGSGTIDIEIWYSIENL